MEILSTGEKIKRARIYKGYTLKDLCVDKISVSKMSCIENDKIKPDEWILDFIAEKLEIDPMYLKQDIRSQVDENIKEIERSRHSDWYEKELEYNLKFAEEFAYFDLAFYIMHLLFNYYLDEKKIEKVQLIVSKYYDYWQKHFSDESEPIYYMDIARYFYTTREFSQAANYYGNVRRISKNKDDSVLLARSTYNEAACYVMMENYEKAYEISLELIDLMDYIESNTKKAEAYNMLAILSLRKDKSKFHEYEQKSYELYKNNSSHRAQAIYNYAVVMFSQGNIDTAIEYINKALECFPKDNREVLVNFILMCTNKLIENNVLDKAKSICDESLNYSIDLDNIKFIEKSYYYKSLILEKEGNDVSAEMYMNLALDALLKFGSKSDIYKRYMEMGNMYYRMGSISESIKYFNFAIQIEKKM
ncbi:helix-turn-helix domain-containing protein [Clostridiaceae bacterium UIB06]|uniref:Helix-turn-helix domain-containing protein n=1 Tax=Clostridium thailandense TaxID=2794346 RepID=A0A949WSE1_9CLOT|nr:helix-turn-helix transcriptional regulator [Clostridium thailandense]MBV7274986.1 helix-turn-helix domain-containing protein [Clostridium thailandense]MCH5137905.1 helix-turn-helix domain-containing protein [Clostridiaceae bacterium UIB06]